MRRLHGMRQRLPGQRNHGHGSAKGLPGKGDHRLRRDPEGPGHGGEDGPPALRPHGEVRRRAGQEGHRGGRLRPIHRPHALQGLCRVRGRLRGPGPRRPEHDGEVRERNHRRRGHAGPLPPRHRVPQVASANSHRVSQREGPRGPYARRQRLGLRRWRGLVLGLRRRHRRPDADGRHAPGLRAGEHGHRRRDRL